VAKQDHRQVGKARARKLTDQLKAWPPALIDLLQASHINETEADLLDALGAVTLIRGASYCQPVGS
jgi:hypothetical protein